MIDSEITLKEISIKQVEKLRCMITNDSKCDKEIKSRIAIAKETFYKLITIQLLSKSPYTAERKIKCTSTYA